MGRETQNVEKNWVDRKLEFLASRVRDRKCIGFLFEPSPRFYRALGNGETEYLEAAGGRIAKHIGLDSIPELTYELGLRMDPKAAGEIRMQTSRRSHIRIPLNFVGNALAIGGILAHEFAHEVLFSKGMICQTEEDFEFLTDLAAIHLGLGKLVINGTFVEERPLANRYCQVGYLQPELKVYAYNRVNKQRSIGAALAKNNLSENALRLLKDYS